MKRFAVIVTTGLAALWLAPAVQAGPMFSDVPENHWAADAVKALAAKGIIEGYPGGDFQRKTPAPSPASKKPATPPKKAKRP